MKVTQIIWGVVLLTAMLLIAGCASIDDSPGNPDLNKQGLLIVAGEGFNPRYDDPKDIKASSTWFITSQKVAEALYADLDKRHVKTQLFINSNSNLDSQTLVAQLIAQNKRDGLIRVKIVHVKNATENTINLILAYSSLQYGKNNQGETVTLGKGMEQSYTLLGKNFEGSQTPLTAFTSDFTSRLKKAGYI